MFWINSHNGNLYPTNQVPSTLDKLPPALYELRYDSDEGGFFLRKVENSFKLPKKVYGLNDSFLARIKTTWKYTSNNLGILLWGYKGTGKSVLSKVICNDLNLPIIIISKKYDFKAILDSIEQDVIVFVDELEKIYGGDFREGNKEDSAVVSLLSLLDGTSTSQYKRLFLFTSNKEYINDCLDNRPGRIRYRKEFKNLTEEVIVEIVDDLLIDKSFREDLIKVLKRLEYITVDSVTSLVREVNIHSEPASILMTDFNLDYMTTKYKITYVELPDDFEKIEGFNFSGLAKVSLGSYYENRLSHSSFGTNDYNDWFRVDGEDYGKIDEVLSSTTALVSDNSYVQNEDGSYLFDSKKKRVMRRVVRLFTVQATTNGEGFSRYLSK